MLCLSGTLVRLNLLLLLLSCCVVLCGAVVSCCVLLSVLLFCVLWLTERALVSTGVLLVAAGLPTLEVHRWPSCSKNKKLQIRPRRNHVKIPMEFLEHNDWH